MSDESKLNGKIPLEAVLNKFKEHNKIYAKNQPQYLPLPTELSGILPL